MNEREEKQRAEQISQLYPTPKEAKDIGPHLVEETPIQWRVIVRSGFALGLTAIIVHTIFALYLNSNYATVTSIQMGSILFILFLMLGTLLCWATGKMVITGLEKVVRSSRAIFLVSIFALIGFSLLVYRFILGSERYEILELFIRTASANLLIIAIAIGVTIATTRLLETGRMKS